jgi:hydrogenase nickel incorporation protein HypA/HybF
MHELSITESILKIALRHAEQAGAKRITRLNLVIGELSGVVGESVQFYWDMIARDTIAQGAELHFEHVPASLRCLDCSHVFPMDGRSTACPECGAGRVVAAGGDDFRLESIEVEEQ